MIPSLIYSFEHNYPLAVLQQALETSGFMKKINRKEVKNCNLVGMLYITGTKKRNSSQRACVWNHWDNETKYKEAIKPYEACAAFCENYADEQFQFIIALKK